MEYIWAAKSGTLVFTPTNSWDLAGKFLNDFMVPGKRLHNH